jgi:programmed cell death protein 5
VKRERATAVETMIANMALQGKMDTKITEGKLIEMLEGIVGAQMQKNGGDAFGKISIQRKRYNFDSDNDDDDDDLL